MYRLHRVGREAYTLREVYHILGIPTQGGIPHPRIPTQGGIPHPEKYTRGGIPHPERYT